LQAPAEQKAPEYGITQTVDPCGDGRWDEFVRNHPAATIFHTSAWAAVLRDTYGHRPAYQLSESSGKCVGGACLLEVRSFLSGKRGVGLPFTDECAVLAEEGSGFGHFWEKAIELAKKKGWRSVEFRGVPPGMSPSVEFLTHNLGLGESAEMFAGIASPVRTAIRKAEKAGITIEIETTSQAIEQYYALHCLTRRKHGAPPQPFRFFANIYEHLIRRGLGFVVLAQHESRAVAGAVFFHFGGRAVYKFGASDPRRANLRPNNLVMWSAIVHLAQIGCKTLNFGRTSLSNDGLRRFKLGWGAEEKRLGYIHFDCGEEKIARIVDRSSGAHTALFSRMPVFLLKQAGAALYPHLD
jgi:hypothetical protein